MNENGDQVTPQVYDILEISEMLDRLEKNIIRLNVKDVKLDRLEKNIIRLDKGNIRSLKLLATAQRQLNALRADFKEHLKAHVEESQITICGCIRNKLHQLSIKAERKLRGENEKYN